MEIIDKGAVLGGNRPLPTEPYEIEGVGWVRIRALTRAEALRLENAGSEATKDAQVLSWGIVEPVFTVAEIIEWSGSAPAGELQGVSTRIAQLSKMLPDSPKESYKSDGDGSDAGV